MRGFRSFAKGLGGAVLGSSDSTLPCTLSRLSLENCRQVTPRNCLLLRRQRRRCSRVSAPARVGWSATGRQARSLRRFAGPAVAQFAGTHCTNTTVLVRHQGDLCNRSCLQAQLAVSLQGLPLLCTVIKEDREDLDMLRTALECLQLTLGHPANHITGSGKVPFQDMI